MKRLASKLRSMDGSTETYTEMYEGLMSIIIKNDPIPISAYEPIYYSGCIGFMIERSNKLAQDKPTVTVMIPADEIMPDNNGGDNLKRLKYYLLQMENSTETYTYKKGTKTYSMYDAETVEQQILPSGPMEFADIGSDPTFWDESGAFYTLERGSKSDVSKTSFTMGIPVDGMGLSPEDNAGFNEYTVAAADFCLRAIRPYFDAVNEKYENHARPDAENGKFYVYSPGGEILVRNSAFFKICAPKDYENGSGNTVYIYSSHEPKTPKMFLCIRIQVQLPFHKIRRTIQMLTRDMPAAVEEFVREFDTAAFKDALALAAKQSSIRRRLRSDGYCAFIADGSLLLRFKGTELPMPDAVPFRSTDGDRVEICGVSGMGIKRGVTVITGGGYSGKTTLLDAISAGIYDHIAGDGRELVLTDPGAVKISAEDGRSVKNVNIAPFIKWLPDGDTRNFSTERASGSTSQAANIMEAVNCGSKLLLIDEDKSATNFMIRDRMMKELIEKEPITPFTDRVNELYKVNGVSTVLVIGGSGEYLSVADKVYLMDDFIISDATAGAKAICASHGVTNEPPPETNWDYRRCLLGEGFTSYPEGSRTEKLEVSDMGFILIGGERVDIRMLHNIVTQAQLNAIGFMLRYLETTNTVVKLDVDSAVDALYLKIRGEGLDWIFSNFFTTCGRFMDMPRKTEVLAVINRMRKIKFTV